MVLQYWKIEPNTTLITLQFIFVSLPFKKLEENLSSKILQKQKGMHATVVTTEDCIFLPHARKRSHKRIITNTTQSETLTDVRGVKKYTISPQEYSH